MRLNCVPKALSGQPSMPRGHSITAITEEDEASSPSAPALATEDSVRPRFGHLIFNQRQEVVHVSASLHLVLELEAPVTIQRTLVMDVITQAVGQEEERFNSLLSWFNQSGEELRDAPETSLLLLTAHSARTLRATISPVEDCYHIVCFEDITAALESHSNVIAFLSQDSLTGIGNRLFFERSLDRALGVLQTSETEQPILLLLDLDRFKLVNDTLGHAAGDFLLKLVSERLRCSLRSADILARLGGDEFGIFLSTACSPKTASELALKLINLIQRPYLIEGQVIHIGASIGIAIASGTGTTRNKLLKDADLALYCSKAVGRGTFHFFEPEMEERALQRRSLEMDLRKAVILRQFELHYQPQIDVESQSITGLEGLLRWRHPRLGMLLPGAFLDLAEEIGLAVPIGDWVVMTACKEAQRWPDTVSIAVNVSPLQFEMKKFATSVEYALKAAGIPGKRLEIEVTENILLRDGETVRLTLHALRALGVRVAIDSFGTGLASISQLVNFPFDKIKIDRSLVSAQEDDTKSRAIVRAISTLGQSLGISTLAEGVETTEQLARVRLEGCDSVQGFYYSKAIPAEELLSLYTKGLLFT